MLRIIIGAVAIIIIAVSLLAFTGMTGLMAGRERGLEELRFGIFDDIYSAIEKAREQGLYACCIEPPCTMCFLKGTEHEFTSEGKYCNCDKLIEEGKEPCPQCKRGLCGQADACTFNNIGG